MADIAEVPMPDVLDPDRLHSTDRDDMTVNEHRSRAQQLDDALHKTSDYAQKLWQTLAATRVYLMDSLPSDPSTGEMTRQSASPTGIDDQVGWDQWIDVYATVTSALAGPHGDSGFGRDEANTAAQNRRARPVLLPSDELDSLPSRRDAAGEGKRVAEAFIRAESERAGGPVPVPPGGPNMGSSGSESSSGEAGTSQRRPEVVRAALEAALFFLALRGLRTRGLPRRRAARRQF